MNSITIQHITPQAGVRGGHIKVSCTGLDAQALETCSIVFGTSPMRPVLVTPTLLLGVVPESTGLNSVQIVQGERQSHAVPFVVATRLADNVHPVANPAVDAEGNIYTTISGTK